MWILTLVWIEVSIGPGIRAGWRDGEEGGIWVGDADI